MKHKLFVISAPSGAGKTSVVNQVIKELNPVTPIERVITYTTKAPRVTEQNNQDYNFLSVQEFQNKINQGFFIEWSKAYHNYYGSPKYIIDQLNERSYILVVDRLGAESLKKVIDPELVSFIWIKVHDLSVLRERLIKRNTETLDQIEKRIQISFSEIEQELKTPLFDDYIYNVKFDQAVADLKDLILIKLGML